MRAPVWTPVRALLTGSLTVLVVVTGLLAGSQPPARAAVPVVAVAGEAVFDGTLLATTEGYAGPVAYQWLRAGAPIDGATSRRYRPGLADLGRALAVTVSGTDPAGAAQVATSAPTGPVARAVLANRAPPTVTGVARFGHVLRAGPGRWAVTPTRVRYQWYRDGTPIPAATRARHVIAPADVGARVRVQVTVKAPGHLATTGRSPRADRVAHRVDVRRTVTYHVETRGAITTSLAQFRRQAQATYDDPRGWRGAGIRFRPVATGGSFTLVLAEASRVPGFSPVCSSSWSCRVGRFVVINQDRWKHASPAWNAAAGALRGYRHMVVDHETGHWLGLGHAGCPGAGRLAPVMMQQSKGLDGCRFNPWPTPAEVAGRTPR